MYRQKEENVESYRSKAAGYWLGALHSGWGLSAFQAPQTGTAWTRDRTSPPWYRPSRATLSGSEGDGGSSLGNPYSTSTKSGGGACSVEQLLNLDLWTSTSTLVGGAMPLPTGTSEALTERSWRYLCFLPWLQDNLWREDWLRTGRKMSWDRPQQRR